MMGKIDPRLQNALRRAEGNVQAIVTLRSNDPSNPLAPEATDASVKSLVRDAERETNSHPKDVVVFSGIQSFSIDADSKLIEHILDHDAVESASLNSY